MEEENKRNDDKKFKMNLVALFLWLVPMLIIVAFGIYGVAKYTSPLPTSSTPTVSSPVFVLENACNCIQDDLDCYTLINGSCIKTTDCSGFEFCVAPGQCTIDYEPCRFDSDCPQDKGCSKCIKAPPEDSQLRYCRIVIDCPLGCNTTMCSCNTLNNVK